MIMKIVNVKINNDFGKTLYFDCNNFNLKKNLTVIVNTERGLEFGTVLDFLDVDAVIGYLAVVNIIETVDKVGYRGFACAR